MKNIKKQIEKERDYCVKLAEDTKKLCGTDGAYAYIIGLVAGLEKSLKIIKKGGVK